MHIYTHELLDKHLLPELKGIAQGLGIVPDGNKTRRDTWVSALIGQPFPLFQSIALEDETVISNTESAGIFTGEGPPNRGDGRGGRVENSIDVDRTSDPIALSDLDVALAEIARLRAENKELLEKVASQSEVIRRAKDVSPVKRPSRLRVTRLAQAVGLNLCKGIKGGWVLFTETLQRGFNTLRDAWELLIVENRSVTDLFRRPPKEPSYVAPISVSPVRKVVPSRDAFSHDRIQEYFSAFRRIVCREPDVIPSADDGLIDSYALGFADATASGRSPPGGDAM